MRTSVYQPGRRTNTFIYTNYFRFAKRKLLACQQLVAHMPEYKDKELEKKVCHELFYLMGYIVEGLSVYVIYDVLRAAAPISQALRAATLEAVKEAELTSYDSMNRQ